MLVIHGIPWITSSETLEFQIQTEPGSKLVVEGSVVETNEEGLANLSFVLEESEMGLFTGQSGVSLSTTITILTFSKSPLRTMREIPQ